MAKASWNNYQTNMFAQDIEMLLDSSSVYHVGQQMSGEGDEDNDVSGVGGAPVVCIGEKTESSFGELLRNWGLYMKRSVSVYESVSDYQTVYEKGAENAERTEAVGNRKDTEIGGQRNPQFILIDSDCIDWSSKNALEEIEFLQSCADEGIHLIFGNLPDVSVIKRYKGIRELMGIASVRQESVTADGIHLYEGFLLGGETIYQPQTEEEENLQDMELTFPWYELSSGTKVYMKGIIDQETVDIQEYPALIWRKSTGNSFVFAVNGNYMKGVSGLGLLTGMLCQMQNYTIYPVVNAQNFVLAGYPVLADENADTLQSMYSQTIRGVFRDIIWSSVAMISQKTSLGISSMIAVQYDYSDDIWPETQELSYYMSSMNEINAEMGYSAVSISDTDIGEKLIQDELFWDESLPTYRFSSLYRGTLSDDEVDTILNHPFLSNVRTIVEPVKDTSDLIGYANEHVTRQCAVIDGYDHTYRQDFLIRSIETALGYTSILTDIGRVAYPQSEEDAWENISNKLMANTTTYWEPFSVFDGTTLSQSDARIRNFLAMSYTEEKEDSSIKVNIKGEGFPVWFVLKLEEGKKVTQVDGGSYSNIENGAWLIEAEQSQIEIKLEQSHQLFYYE